MGYVRPKRAKRPANRPKWPSNSFRRRVWATCFFEIHDPGAFDEHFFNGLLVGTDPAGYAGLEDDVDWHWNRIFAGAVLTTLLGVGAELAAPENRQDGNRIVIAGRDSAQDSINQVGQEITRRNMNIQPTLTTRPGLPVRIIVNRDLVLRPYQPLFFNRGASQ